MVGQSGPQCAVAIEAAGVSFTYPDGTKALEKVDFCVESGQCMAILAANGSGKTTLLKVLAGLLRPQEGTVRINGVTLHKLSSAVLYQQVGLVLQNPQDQLFSATVDDDVAFGPRNLGLSATQVEERVEWALQSVGALPLRQRAIHHLSFGEQKRVSVAGILAMRPKILILDEPTAGLDPAGESQMIHLLNRLNREEKISIVLATHSVDMVAHVADRLTLLKGGQLWLTGTAQEVFADREKVEQAGLRQPYIARLFHEMMTQGVPMGGFPLTVEQGLRQMFELLQSPLDTTFGTMPGAKSQGCVQTKKRGDLI